MKFPQLYVMISIKSYLLSKFNILKLFQIIEQLKQIDQIFSQQNKKNKFYCLIKNKCSFQKGQNLRHIFQRQIKNISQMRNKNYTKTDEHVRLRQQITLMRQQNEKLKKRLQKMQDAMHEVYISKKKYKNRYKQLKQKLDILQTVYKPHIKDNLNIYSTQYYKNQVQNHNSRSTKNNISNANNLNRNQSKNNIKQDLTAHTLLTMPSSRRSQLQNYMFKKNTKINMKQSNLSCSQGKQVGKIFKFKSPQRQRYQSSGSQNQLEYENQHTNVYNNKRCLTQQSNQLIAPSNNIDDYQIYNNKQQIKYNSNSNNRNSRNSQYHQKQQTQISKNQSNSLKQMIYHLLSELKNFSSLYLHNEQSPLSQKQNKMLFKQTSQTHLRSKLQEICSKLKEIQKNQEIFMLRSQRQQKSVNNIYNTKVKSQKSLNKSTAGGKLNTSFLKTIQDIGKDLTEWKIDYYN